MARKKVAIEYIASDPTRKATARKRDMGIKKKAGELSVLCGVDTCYIMYREGGASPPEVYPSVPEAMRVIDRFRAMPELDQCKKKMDGEDYVRERIAKIQEQLRRAQRDNRQLETTLLLHDALVGRRQGLAGVAIEQLVSLGWMAESYVKKVSDCIAYRSMQQQPQPQLQHAGVQAEPPHYAAAVADVEAPPHQQL
ncbi:hypothetical protein CFC21_072885 [Triticum aestivum]|uniref:MADS-box domain-containing protein n=3 Tax=Triticum TaxID=4564 RepID=A0A9R1HKW7_WHEAT|nr:agamous-like MADS-box protein AGL80 [Triticum dicoccoides]XP_044344406.1 agamous-like MADS-box protein AGL80 [Triticum aestivum]KAF7066968.1 hypothetical protein CFC21_072885 [Triticum aestivum]CDM82069.1 unnamed protein product [Triticum aestivum]VAH74324.1 unnamed protein product [Triticum turgidum subsp. durum]